MQECAIKETLSEAAHKSIEQLTQQLAELDERQEELAERLRARTGEDGEGAGGGTNVVVKLKEALQTLKTQIRTMNIDICLLNNNLLTARKQQAELRANYRRNKALEESMNANLFDND